MSEGAASERTPESAGIKAIEDAGPNDGLMRPAGPPVVLGPDSWNPFWSEKMQDEAVLRALRPVDLPVESPELLPDPGMSPPKEGAEAFRAFIQNIMSENARLWTEREAWSHGQFGNGWGGPHQPPMYGQPPPWWSGAMPHASRERNLMGSLLESLRSSWVSPGHAGNKGLLGPLASGRDWGGQGALPGLHNDPGVRQGQFGGPRASLMEVFNRVSSTSGDMVHGMLEASRTLARHGMGSSWSDPWPPGGKGQKGYVSGEPPGGTVGGRRGPGQGLSGHRDPGEQLSGSKSQDPQEVAGGGSGVRPVNDPVSGSGSHQGSSPGCQGGGHHGGAHQGGGQGGGGHQREGRQGGLVGS